MEWKEHKLVRAVIISLSGGPCTVRSDVRLKLKKLKSFPEISSQYYLIKFNTVKGKTYEMTSL